MAERRCAYNPTSAAYFFLPRGLLIKRRSISLAIASRANSARDLLAAHSINRSSNHFYHGKLLATLTALFANAGVGHDQ